MDFLAAIRRDSDRFYATAEKADPTARVPSCPEWTVADLVWHLGEVHWFWGTDVETRASAPKELEKQKPPRPATYDELVAWGRAQADRLIKLLEDTPDDVRVWTWALNESDHNVGFVRRHQVQEAALHRWDIESAAAGQPQPIEPDVASDSIDEVLAITLPWGARPDKPLPGTVHLHCTDVGAGGEWFVGADGLVERTHAKADAALRGTASDVLLALYTRIPLDSGAVEVVGDAYVAQEFLARINTD